MSAISKEKIIGMLRAASAAMQQTEGIGRQDILSKIKKAEEEYKRTGRAEMGENEENAAGEKGKQAEGERGKELEKMPEENLEEIADKLVAAGKLEKAIANYEKALSENQSYETLKKLAFAYISSGYPALAAERLGSYQARDLRQERSVKILRIRAMLLSADEKIREEGLLLCSSMQGENYLDLDALLEEGLAMAGHSDYAGAKGVSQKISSWINSKKNVFYTKELDSAEKFANYFLKEADYPEAENLCSAIFSIFESESMLEIRARAVEKFGFRAEVEAAALELRKKFPENKFAGEMAEKYGLGKNGRH